MNRFLCHTLTRFAPSAPDVHHGSIWWVCVTTILALTLTVWSSLQAAALQQETAAPIVPCTMREEFVLECKPTDNAVEAAAAHSPTAVQPGGTIVLLGSANWLSVRSLFLQSPRSICPSCRNRTIKPVRFNR